MAYWLWTFIITGISINACAMAKIPETKSDKIPLEIPCRLETQARVASASHDLVAIYRNVKALNVLRDEYETNIQYEDRLSKILKNASPAVSEGAVCISEKIKYTSAEYDADNQVLWVPFLLDYKKFKKDPSGNYSYGYVFAWRSTKRIESVYRAENSFGVSRDVQKLEAWNVILLLNAADTKAALIKNGATVRSSYLMLPVNLTPDIARTIKPNVRAVAQYELKKPFIGTDEDFEVPTIDSPFESNHHNSVIFARIIRIAVVNSTTGEVLKRFELTP